jgi:hypothetical protein
MTPRSIPYYHNALGDPRWPPKRAESSTEEDGTSRYSTQPPSLRPRDVS